MSVFDAWGRRAMAAGLCQKKHEEHIACNTHACTRLLPCIGTNSRSSFSTYLSFLAKIKL